MIRVVARTALIVLLSGVALSQSADKPPAFDVADVHVSPNSMGAGMQGVGIRGGRFELLSATMVDLIRTAYGVDADRVIGGPSWLETDHFDVIAKAPPATSSQTANLMLQTLLADRFKLAVQKDSKAIPAYVLTAGKSPKLKTADDSGKTGCQGQPPSAPPPPGVILPQVVSCHGMTMAAFADLAHQMAGGYVGDHPVVDSTKLEGAWDFDIKWTGRGQLTAAGADGISFFDAVDKQLGLKLELQTVSLPVIIVDKVNQKPTDNLPGVGQSLPAIPTEFEAAEIKLLPPDSTQQGIGFRYQAGGRIDGTGSLRDLMAVAFDVPPNIFADMLVGAPKWMETDRFSIVAKAPMTGGPDVAPPISALQVMIRALIVDRFKLKTHTEDQQTTVYALLAPKGESKLKKADDSERAGCKADPNAAQSLGTPGAFACQNTTMVDLGKFIQMRAGAYIDHPIVDATGLTGGWDFVLGWTPKAALLGPARPADAAAGGVASAADPNGISLFEAVEKQLGLKLEMQKHALSVIVVDHVEKLPE